MTIIKTNPNKLLLAFALIIDKNNGKFDTRAVVFAYSELNPTQIEISRDTEGNATFEIYITHKEEIKRFIKSDLPDIRILSPKWLYEEIK